MKFFEGLCLLLIGLKLTNLITISWWLVAVPLVWQWCIAPIVLGVLLGLVAKMVDDANGDRKMHDAIFTSFLNCLGKKSENTK